jgi:bifunctional UDP-N-acetylglucosamine pyrophosphorylase/glucosamine-1-phosphate N-acetyltransferase
MSNTLPNNVGVVILAAGHGTRMKSELPKVMHELNGKPLVAHVVDNARAAGIVQKPVVVVSPKSDLVREYFGDTVEYAVQEEQLGTGHATASAAPVLRENIEHVVVLYGDMPFLRPDSIARLVRRHEERGNTLTMMTVTVPNFEHPYTPFYNFGRVIRDEQGHIVDSVEKKDATPEQVVITEVNPCYYCFRTDWLWEHVTKLQNNNVQHEYYLTDLVHIAIAEGARMSSVATDPHEALGINSPEDLELAQKAMSLRNFQS